MPRKAREAELAEGVGPPDDSHNSLLVQSPPLLSNFGDHCNLVKVSRLLERSQTLRSGGRGRKCSAHDESLRDNAWRLWSNLGGVTTSEWTC